MKRLILVMGEPGSGKSYLAEKLANDHSFVMISVDSVYVDFVRSKCYMLYFEALNKYIGPHYTHILSNSNYSKEHFKGRDFAKEWREYLLLQIESKLTEQNDRIVVEGYLLKDCQDYLRTELHSKVKMFPIQVTNMTYKLKNWNNRTLTLEQVAALGSDALPRE